MTGQGRVEFFRRSMGVLGAAFFVGGFLFLIFPDQFIQMTNWFPRGGAAAAPVVSPASPPRLWPILTFTMMMMIAAISGLNWLDPRKYHGWVPLLLFAKACSSLTGLLVFWLSSTGYLADLLSFLTDFPIFLFVLVIYLRARPELAEPRLAA